MLAALFRGDRQSQGIGFNFFYLSSSLILIPLVSFVAFFRLVLVVFSLADQLTGRPSARLANWLTSKRAVLASFSRYPTYKCLRIRSRGHLGLVGIGLFGPFVVRSHFFLLPPRVSQSVCLPVCGSIGPVGGNLSFRLWAIYKSSTTRTTDASRRISDAFGSVETGRVIASFDA